MYSEFSSFLYKKNTMVQYDLVLQLDCSIFAANAILFKTELQESDQGQVSNHIFFFRFIAFIQEDVYSILVLLAHGKLRRVPSKFLLYSNINL